MTAGTAIAGATVTAGGNKYYQLTYATAGVYTITVSAMTADVDPLTYSDATFTTPLGVCTFNTGVTNDTCQVPVTANQTVYVKVSDWSGAGATFTVTPGNVDGTVALTALLANVNIAAMQGSFYKITAAATAVHTVETTSAVGSYTLAVYSDQNYQTPLGVCTYSTGTSRGCTFYLTVGQNAYVLIKSASFMTITMSTVAPQSWGPAHLSVAGTLYSGIGTALIAPTVAKITLPKAVKYVMTAGLNASKVTLFSDAALTTSIGTCSRNGRYICEVTAATVNQVVYALLEDTSGSGTAIAQSLYNSYALTEGTAFADNIPAATGPNYYTVTYATAGTKTFTVSGMTQDVDPMAYDNAMTNIPTCTGNAGVTADTCTVRASAGQRFYFKITDRSGGMGPSFNVTP